MDIDESLDAGSGRAEILGVDRLLTSQEVADQLGITEGALRTWRYQGDGPPYVKLGSRVRYRLGAVRLCIRGLQAGGAVGD